MTVNRVGIMTDQAKSQHVDQTLAWAGVLGPIIFVMLFTVAGWLRPGFSATEEAVSDLGVGPQAWIQNANFVLFGLLLLAFAVGFARIMDDVMGRRRSRIGAFLIALTGIGITASAVFPAAPPTEGLHFLLGFLLAFGSAIVTAFYVGRRLRGVAGWDKLARYSFWTGIGAIGLVVLSFVALNPASPLEEAGIGGVIERVLAIEVFGWHVVTGWRLRQHAASASARRSHGPVTSPRDESQ